VIDALDRTPDAPAHRAGAGRAALVVVLGVFALLYAYDVLEAVQNLTGMVSSYVTPTSPINPTGWSILVGGIALPILVYAIAVVLGRRGGVLRLGFLLFVGWAVVAALSFGFVSVPLTTMLTLN
jgi:hypothetical protein